MTNLNLVFQSLPEKVKKWLDSEEVGTILFDIGKKLNLNLDQELSLSNLVLRLVARDLPPESFISEIQKAIGLDKGQATELVTALDQKVLRVMTEDLLTLGIDIKLLYYSPTQIPEVTSANRPAEIRRPESSKPADGPFILHDAREAQPVTESPEAKPSFIFRPPPPLKTPENAAAKVIIERVVHYSNFFTPLNRAPLRYYQKVKVPKSRWFV